MLPTMPNQFPALIQPWTGSTRLIGIARSGCRNWGYPRIKTVRRDFGPGRQLEGIQSARPIGREYHKWGLSGFRRAQP